jgi:flagellar protein FliO/FliZ
MTKRFLAVLIISQVLLLEPMWAAADAEPFFANETKSNSAAEIASVSTIAEVPQVTNANSLAVASAPSTESSGPVKLAENEIPLNITEKKTPISAESGLSRVFLSLGILLVAGIGMYFYMKKFMKPRSNSNQQIKVLTQHYLGPKKSLAIIRVAGESVLIGITDHNISMIKSLALLDEEIPEFSEKDFSLALEKTNNRMQSDRKDMDLEDFSMKGIRDIVSKKLSNMRTLE